MRRRTAPTLPARIVSRILALPRAPPTHAPDAVTSAETVGARALCLVVTIVVVLVAYVLMLLGLWMHVPEEEGMCNLY